MIHSMLSYRTTIVRYNTRTMEILGNFAMEKLLRYSTLSYRIAIVRVLWRTIAQNPGTVRLWLSLLLLSLLLLCTSSLFTDAESLTAVLGPCSLNDALCYLKLLICGVCNVVYVFWAAWKG
jgi:hypothetical protein